MTMRDYEREICSELFNKASDEFNNHGCNDFDIARLVPRRGDRDALFMEFCEWNGDLSEYRSGPETGPDYRFMDWMLFAFYADKIRTDG